jgi:hypothetical protein
MVEKSNQTKKGNHHMLDQLKDLFKEGLGYTHVAGILQQVSNIVNIVNVQYVKDVDAKNLAIDIICALIQSHKEVPAVTVEAKNAAT